MVTSSKTSSRSRNRSSRKTASSVATSKGGDEESAFSGNDSEYLAYLDDIDIGDGRTEDYYDDNSFSVGESTRQDADYSATFNENLDDDDNDQYDFDGEEESVSMSWLGTVESSVQTPSVQTFSVQDPARSTTDDVQAVDYYEESPTINSAETPSIDENEPTIQDNYSEEESIGIPSVMTPSVHSASDAGEELDDASELGSVMASVLGSVFGGTSKYDRDQVFDDIIEDDETSRASQMNRESEYMSDNDTENGSVFDSVEKNEKKNTEAAYESFMNEFNNKGADIVNKRTVGLSHVMSTTTGMDSSEEDDEPVRTSKKISHSSSGANRSSKSSKPPLPTAPRGNGKGKKYEKSWSTERENEDFADAEENSVLGDASATFTVESDSDFPSHINSQGRNPNGFLQKTGRRMKIVGKKSIKLRKEAEVMMGKLRYKSLAKFVQQNPEIVGIQSEQPHGRTLLHTIALQKSPLPENVILKIISHDPSLVAVTDNKGYTPLHYATEIVQKSNLHVFVIFLKFHPAGATERNSNGDIPLHLAAANPNRGSEEAIHLLLQSYSKGLLAPNNKGKIPLHLALTEGSSNLKSLIILLQMHKARRSSVSTLDNRGHSPLHCAIAKEDNLKAIETFNQEVRDTFLSAYMQETDEGFLPLHSALTEDNPDSMLILSLIKAAPYAGGVPIPSGEMPITIATKRQMDLEIIKALLASDLPIELGNKKGNSSGMGIIVEREHGHSWWHVAVECKRKYVDVIRSLLTDYASFVQVVALARCLGPDGTTMTIQAASKSLKAAFQNMLRFYYRYEISTSKLPIFSSEIQSFPAVDHGEELEKLEVKGPWLHSGYAAVNENNRNRTAANDAHEVSYTPWTTTEKEEVTLRCYAFDDAFNSELSVREKYNISTEFIEEILHHHRVSNYVNASFTTGKLLCIAFERNEITLKELMGEHSRRKQRNWPVMLKDIALALDHLHGKCLIHGNLDTSSVARFQHKWKLLDVGGSSLMGNAMSGELRRNIPPESVVRHKLTSNLKSQTASDKHEDNKKKGMKSSTNNSNSRGRSRSRGRFFGRGSSKSMSLSRKQSKNGNLPPLPGDPKRKKFGIFVFGMKDLGLGDYGGRRTRSSSRGARRSRRGLDDNTSIDSRSTMGSKGDAMTTSTDEGSLRIIAMQEDEITRLREALEEKEHVYRRQLAEERASFKRQEVAREREQKKYQAKAKKIQKSAVPRFAPEKVMASPTWDIWSFGILMTEMLVGKTLLLPSNQESNDEFLEKLIGFDEIQVTSIREEVRDTAGDLAADLVARLIHPNPHERIESMSKVLQHKYFHEESMRGINDVQANERNDEKKGFRKRSRSRRKR